MSTIVLTKNNERSSRPACKRCGNPGNQGYYWATSSATGRNVMIERIDGVTIEAPKGATVPLSSIHKCFRKDAGLTDEAGESTPDYPAVPDEETAIPAPQEAQEGTPAPRPYVRGENPLADAIRDIVGPVQIDKAEVERIAREVVGGYVFPTQTVVIRDGETKTVPGLAHERLPRVLAALAVGENVLMEGPAGTGKSHISEQCSEALGVPYYSLSLTSQTGEAKLTGFVDAGGSYHGTEVYEWASNPDGGVLNFDEMDNGNPNILGWLNAMIANRRVRFPNGEVFKLTASHFITATANTFGFGRTREYVGRNPIDAATKDRFATVTINIDDALETALVHGTGVKAATADRILGYVRKLRTSADAKGVNIVMSPRNSVGMARMLTSDTYDWEMAVEDRIRCGIDDSTWSKLTA